MNCDEINTLLSEYIDGLLDERERDLVRDHLAGCPGCRETCESMSVIASHMQRMEPVPEPDDFVEKVAARIEAGTSVRDRIRRFFVPSWIRLPLGLAGAATAVLIIVYATGIFTHRERFNIAVQLESPPKSVAVDKKSKGTREKGTPDKKRGPADAAALRAVIDSLGGRVIDSSPGRGSDLPATLKIEIKASRCETLLRKCEELGILLESTGALPDAGDELVTVTIAIRYRDDAP